MVDDPALRVYMRQVDDYPLLTREEQTAAAKEFRRAAGRYQWAMLTSDYVLARAVDALAEVLAGQQRIEFVVEVGIGNSADKQRIEALLPEHLQQLRCHLQRNEQDFRVAVCRRAADSDRHAAWRRLVARRHRAAQLVVDLKLRTKHVSRCFGELCEIAHRMEQLRNRLRRSRGKGGRSRAIRGELAQLMKLTLESPKTLCRRIERAAARQEEYGKAKHALAVSGLRLVLSLARRYRGRGVAYSDLIQEGNVGLLRAVEKFDHHRGSFSNCARWWIRQAICLAVARQTRTPTIPKTMRDAVDRVKHVRFTFAQEFSRQPTLDETAAACRLSLRETEAALLFSQPPLSIDQREPSQGMKRFADLLRAANGDPAKHASHTLDWELLRNEVVNAMQRLDNRQEQVISLRFGFTDGKSRSLRQVASVMSVSHEYVRQVVARAMAKLRTPALESLAMSWFR